jgi:hypothetical protein
MTKAKEVAMKSTFWFLEVALALGLGTGWAGQTAATVTNIQNHGDAFRKAGQSMVFILVGDGSGRVQSVSTGVMIRADGIVLTAYHPLKGAQEVQVRLRDGEVFDQVALRGFDERRDVAALSISASGLACLSSAAMDEAVMGEKIQVLNADGAMAWSASDGVLGPVRLADEVPGAGRGFRVVEFMAPATSGALGGAVVNARGQLVGIVPPSVKAGGPQFAVPAESVAGLPFQGLHIVMGSGRNLAPPAIVPNSLPASDAPPAPTVALASARTLHVNSKTSFFTSFMLEKELVNNQEFRSLEVSVLEGNRAGDLVITIDRPLFTYDFTYSVSDGHSGTVLATGKVTALDGPHAAPGIAGKLIQELEKARVLEPAQSTRPEGPIVQ